VFGAWFFCTYNPAMSLCSTDIARIANLARLEFQADESAQLLAQMNDFFAIVEKMQTVDTSGIAPLAHPMAAVADITLRLHADVVTEADQRTAYMRNAPAAERGLFLVPKVIE
jgi:aspartyl-tRNA(Asn)/glutamyl-tRNA(Gln) amidotransferase subunit C